MNVQELVREAVRDKIEQEVSEEYLQFLRTNPQATTCSSPNESKAFINTLRSQSGLK